MTAQVHDRITIGADTMDGQPCIRCAFPVVTVLRMVAAGRCLLQHSSPTSPTS